MTKFEFYEFLGLSGTENRKTCFLKCLGWHVRMTQLVGTADKLFFKDRRGIIELEFCLRFRIVRTNVFKDCILVWIYRIICHNVCCA